MDPPSPSTPANLELLRHTARVMCTDFIYETGAEMQSQGTHFPRGETTGSVPRAAARTTVVAKQVVEAPLLCFL